MQVDTVPLGGDANSWVLTSEGTGLHNGQVVSRIRQGQQLPVEGDIIVSTVLHLVIVHHRYTDDAYS